MITYNDVHASLKPVLDQAKAHRDACRHRYESSPIPKARDAMEEYIAAQARVSALIDAGIAITLGSPSVMDAMSVAPGGAQ